MCFSQKKGAANFYKLSTSANANHGCLKLFSANAL